jgi:hypothetical protein
MFANLMPQEPPFFEMFAALGISCQAAMGLGTLFGGWRRSSRPWASASLG